MSVINYRVIDTDTVAYTLRMGNTIGTFDFNSFALYQETAPSTYVCVGLFKFDHILVKQILTMSDDGNTMEITARISLTNVANLTINTNIISPDPANILEDGSPDFLTAPSFATVNAYILNGTGSPYGLDDQGNSIIAYKIDNTHWAFSTHPHQFLTGTVASSTNLSLTSTAGQIHKRISSYFALGRYILKFTSGAHNGICRMITGSPADDQITWATSTGAAPAAGTTFIIYQSEVSRASGLKVISSNTTFDIAGGANDYDTVGDFIADMQNFFINKDVTVTGNLLGNTSEPAFDWEHLQSGQIVLSAVVPQTVTLTTPITRNGYSVYLNVGQNNTLRGISSNITFQTNGATGDYVIYAEGSVIDCTDLTVGTYAGGGTPSLARFDNSVLDLSIRSSDTVQRTIDVFRCDGTITLHAGTTVDTVNLNIKESGLALGTNSDYFELEYAKDVSIEQASIQAVLNFETTRAVSKLFYLLRCNSAIRTNGSPTLTNAAINSLFAVQEGTAVLGLNSTIDSTLANAGFAVVQATNATINVLLGGSVTGVSTQHIIEGSGVFSVDSNSGANLIGGITSSNRSHYWDTTGSGEGIDLSKIPNWQLEAIDIANHPVVSAMKRANTLLGFSTYSSTESTSGTVTPTGATRWGKGVLGPDGCIYSPPVNLTINTILKQDPVAGTESEIAVTATSNTKYHSGVLSGDGNIYYIPINEEVAASGTYKVLKYNVYTGAQTTINVTASASMANAWYGCSMNNNGWIVAVPYTVPAAADAFLVIDTNTDTVSFISYPGGGLGSAYVSCVTGPDNKIYTIPHEESAIYEIDPEASTATLVGSVSHVYSGGDPTPAIASGGVIGSDGRIYCIPFDDEMVLIIDVMHRYPSGAVIYEKIHAGNLNGWTITGSLVNDRKWYGGCAAGDGKIYGAPHDNDNLITIDPGRKTIVVSSAVSTADTSKYLGFVQGPDGTLYSTPFSINTAGVPSFLRLETTITPALSFDVLLSPFVNKG